MELGQQLSGGLINLVAHLAPHPPSTTHLIVSRPSVRFEFQPLARHHLYFGKKYKVE